MWSMLKDLILQKAIKRTNETELMFEVTLTDHKSF